MVQWAHDGVVWAAVGVAALAAALVAYRAHLTRDLGRIEQAWQGLLPLLEERRHFVRRLSARLRQRLPGGTYLVDDIEYVLAQEQPSGDAALQAATQNGLVLTVQRALEAYRQRGEQSETPDLRATVAAIGVTDSRIGSHRDLYNAVVARHNQRISGPLPSFLAALLGVAPKAEFAMLIPWWGLDDPLGNGSRAEEILHRWGEHRSPLIVPPSVQVGTVQRPGGYAACGPRRSGALPVASPAGGM